MSDLDEVYTVADYWDGPRAGVANFRGEPHVYECIFDEAQDDWSDQYRLTPIGQDALEAVREQWEIWSRWRAAFDAGATLLDTHPALPHERERYLQLKGVLDRAVVQNQPRSFVAQGKFTAGRSDVLHGDLRSFKVTWHLATV